MTDPSPALATQARAAIIRSIGIVCLASFGFTIVNLIGKAVMARYPLNEVMVFRAGFGLISVLGLMGFSGGVAMLRTRRPGAHAVRAALGVMSMGCMFLGLERLPLADVTAVNFSGPLFITAMSVPLLGERVGVHRWSAVAVGFLGVLIMVRPGTDAFGMGGAIVLFSSATYALAVILIRRMAPTEASSTIVFYNQFGIFLFALAMLPFGWIAPSWTDLGMMLAMGLLGGVSQYLVTTAFNQAPVAVVAPFNYTQLLWALLFDLAIFGFVPSGSVLAGAAIVMASGLYILHREARVRRVKGA